MYDEVDSRYVSRESRKFDYPECVGLWYETPLEIEAALRLGKQKLLLLAWVRIKMRELLTVNERYFIERHYFDCKTFRDMAKERNVRPSTAHRGVTRGIEKLRNAAATDERITGILGVRRLLRLTPPRRVRARKRCRARRKRLSQFSDTRRHVRRRLKVRVKIRLGGVDETRNHMHAKVEHQTID
jgi:hypothetical protein